LVQFFRCYILGSPNKFNQAVALINEPPGYIFNCFWKKITLFLFYWSIQTYG